MKDPGTGTTTYVYDASSNLTNVIDQLNHKTTYAYDAAGRQTKTIDARGGVTTLLHDAVGNRTSLIDPVGNRTTFAYDGLNRLTQETDPLTKNVTYAYDGNSRLTSRTDRLGRRRDYVYDSEGRVQTETWVNSGGGTADILTYTYDAHGNVLTAANGNGTYTMSYDSLDRVTGVDQPFGQRLTFVYDAVGNRTRVEDSKGGVATSTYNAANRLTKREHTGQAPLRIDFTYTARDQVETATRYSDLAGTTKVGSSTYTYDAAARLKNLQHRNGSGTLFSNYTYTYDVAHRLETETYNGTTVTYTYDDTNQLTGDGSNSYSYDLNGNRTMTGYQTGTGNRLTNDGTWTYTYDDEGNTTKKSKSTSNTSCSSNPWWDDAAGSSEDRFRFGRRLATVRISERSRPLVELDRWCDQAQYRRKSVWQGVYRCRPTCGRNPLQSERDQRPGRSIQARAWGLPIRAYWSDR
jgi:YD repeat-containing protein